MWPNAASYISSTGGTCGIHLRELEEGRGELALFFDGQAGAAAPDPDPFRQLAWGITGEKSPAGF
jgi:hypothetical protein